MTSPGVRYALRHRVSGRWVARRGRTFFWHSDPRRACVVRGGPKLDALLASRRDLEAAARSPKPTPLRDLLSLAGASRP